MHTIVIDDEVFGALGAQVRNPWREAPNDVLRRLLGLSETAERVGAADEIPGQLGPLIRGGALHPGQALTWHRRNLGRLHIATVTAGGCLLLEDGTVAQGPDIAARRLAGHPAKGWTTFKTGDGASLADLAAALPPAP